MLTLHHADELEPLLTALAGVLAPPLADPFAPHVVAVPSAGMSDAVMAALGAHLGATGRRDGIVANVDFVFPGQFVARALGGVEPDADPWSIERLTWTVLRVIDENPSLLPWAGGTGRDPWALARRIADLFDQYATQRPALISSWAAGQDTDGTLLQDGTQALLDAGYRWQAHLWRAVRETIGQPSPPERLPLYLQQLRDGLIVPALPDRVSVFGLGSLPTTFLTVLRALAQVIDVHVFMRHPSRVAWSSAGNRLAGAVQVRNKVDLAAHINHPLLASWGRPAVEARALIAGMPEIDEKPEDREPLAPTTLLEHVQHGIRHDLAPAPAAGLSDSDQSLQVHACHGELRQLEVLRDALGHAFVADPTLQAHEVLVLCPDLERFAPLVESVLDRGSLKVPVRVGDRSLTTEDPLAGVLLASLELVEGRATLSQVLSLAQREPVRTRFGWEADHIGKIAEWCTELGTHWGLLPEHRMAWGIPAEVTGGTWRAMSERLLAGAALPAPVDRVVLGKVVPYDDMGSEDVALAGTMADLLARLVWLHQQVSEPQPIEFWINTLHSAADHFCAVGRDDAWRIAALHHVLDDILAAATTADGPSTVPLTVSDVKALLTNHLGERPGRLRLRSGAVTVTSLIPLRGVPARVVCILGLDDGSVRAGSVDGDDVLGARPCVGERNARDDSRQLLLDALLSAKDRLIITCNGADLTTNHEVPFVVALAELLETVSAVAGRSPVVKHPRHGFNETALRPGKLVAGSGQPFTFDPSMLAAAEARRRAFAAHSSGSSGDTGAPTSPWSVPARRIDTVTIGDVFTSITNPSRTFLRERLDVRLPGEVDTMDDGLAVDLDPLEMSSLGRALLAARRLNTDVEEWVETARLSGTLPPGDLSTAALDSVVGEVQGMEAVLADWNLPAQAVGEVEVALELDVPVGNGESATVQFTGVIEGIDDAVLVDIRYARPRASQRLGLALRLAALQAAQPDTDWTAVLVTRGTGKKAVIPATGMRVRGTGPERANRARAFLVRALELHEWALRDAVPLFDRASEALALGDWGRADTRLAEDLKDDATRFLWGDVSVDDLRDAPSCVDDPGSVQPSPFGGRGVAAAQWIWGLLRESMEYVDKSGAVVNAPDGGEGGDDE